MKSLIAGTYRRLQSRQRRKEKAGEEESVKRADASGLENLAQSKGFLAAADALLLASGREEGFGRGKRLL